MTAAKEFYGTIEKMYLHIGENTTIYKENIIGIFDLDNASIGRDTKDFLKSSTERGDVLNASYELPKSFILCTENSENKVYISQLAPSTLKKRFTRWSVSKNRG